MKAIDFHRMAQKDLDEAVAYYERQRKGLGLDLNTEVELAVVRIRRNPKQFPPYKETKFRKLVLNRFPFNIFFELDAYIWVAAVAHHKRRPDYWRRRKPE